MTAETYKVEYSVDHGVSHGFGLKYDDNIKINEELEARDCADALIKASERALELSYGYMTNNKGHTYVLVASLKDSEGNEVDQVKTFYESSNSSKEELDDKFPYLFDSKGKAFVKTSLSEILLRNL